MHDDHNGLSGRRSPDVEYAKTVDDRPSTPSTPQLRQASDPADAPHRVDSTNGLGENVSMGTVSYPQTPTPIPAYSYHQPCNEYPGMTSSYGYSMYPASYLYPGVALPPPPLVRDGDSEQDWRGASTMSTHSTSTRLWRPHTDNGSREMASTPYEKRTEDRSPRRREVSPMDDAPRREQASDRSWLDAVRSRQRPDCDNVIWLQTTILSSACKIREPYDDHVIHLLSAQRVRIGAWRTRSVKTDIYFYFPEHTYGEVQPSPQAMLQHPSLVVERQRIPFIPNDGVTVMVHNASQDTLTIRPGAEIAHLVILQALVPKFVVRYAKRDHAHRTTDRRSGPRDGDDSTDV